MRTILLLINIILLAALPSTAQQTTTITGKVTSDDNGKPIAAASVAADDGRTATVTNEDGIFSLKVPLPTRHIKVSCLGYATRMVDLPADGRALDIRLRTTAVTLNEVLVANAEDVLRLAIDNIPENYAAQPLLQQCFYRETTRKGRKYIYVAEAITDMYKTPYSKDIRQDRVAIRKARRLVSTQASDTLGAKIAGGPVTPVNIDIVKNRDYLFSEEMLAHYSFSMRPAPLSDGRAQVVVTIKPRRQTDFALLMGDFYIDTETLAITHIDLELDMSNRDKATLFMLESKPLGVRFKPIALEIHINYKSDAAGKLSLNYIRTDVSFRCEWKRKLFSSPYVVTSEMVVTDETTAGVQPIKGRSAFHRHETLYDRVDYFSDPAFWEQYNIIEPSRSLEKGIEGFIKNIKKHQ